MKTVKTKSRTGLSVFLNLMFVQLKEVRPGASTEFGAKISASLVDGYCFLDRLGWDNYNESGDLITRINAYKKRFGFYPSSVHADQIYRNAYEALKAYGISQGEYA